MVGEESYFRQVADIQTWCQSSHLIINVAKTKEVLFQTKAETANCTSLILDNQPVEQVNHFKYLGTTIDNTLCFKVHSESIVKRANQRLFLIRKLNSFGVSHQTMELAYRGLVESILTFNSSAWFGNLGAKHRNQLESIVRTASKVIGKSQRPLAGLVNTATLRKAKQICGDATHPLHKEFELLPSGRRYRAPRVLRNIYKKSFIPLAIQALNLAS